MKKAIPIQVNIGTDSKRQSSSSFPARILLTSREFFRAIYRQDGYFVKGPVARDAHDFRRFRVNVTAIGNSSWNGVYFVESREDIDVTLCWDPCQNPGGTHPQHYAAFLATKRAQERKSL